MFSAKAAANATFRRSDHVADLDIGLCVPGPMGPPVILKAYRLYPVAHSAGNKIYTLIASFALELLEERHVVVFIPPIRLIRGVAVERH